MDNKYFLIKTNAFLLLIIFITSCSFKENMTVTPIPSPLPRQLENLPIFAKMKCTGHKFDQETKIVVNGLPGVESLSDSSSGGYRGNTTGILLGCTNIKINAYQWSSSDQEYYVQIIESESSIGGWVPLSMITFNN